MLSEKPTPHNHGRELAGLPGLILTEILDATNVARDAIHGLRESADACASSEIADAALEALQHIERIARRDLVGSI